MVLVYDCPECNLHFQLGWYHYGYGPSPYYAKTLLVCKQCGVEHGLEHACSTQTFWQKLRGIKVGVSDRLLAQEATVIRPKYEYSKTEVFSAGWHKSELTDDLPLEKLKCLHCNARGQLIDKWPENGAPCPCCSTMIPQTNHRWMT